MKKTALAVAMLAAIGHAPASFATNWFQLQNTEAPGAPAVKFWGFIQPQYVNNAGGAVTGLKGAAAPYNNQAPVFNTVGPDLAKTSQAQIFRARPGLRGAVADGKVNYFLLGELGNNGLTTTKQAVFTDASVTFNTSVTRIRLGLGRLPIGEEAMLGEPALDYINFTNVTDGLLNERFVIGSKAAATAPSTLRPGTARGSVGAFRDTGIELFDWFKKDKMEYAYALMVSEGNGVGMLDNANGGNTDVTGRLQASYVFGGKGPKREDLTGFIWHQEGKRIFSGANYNRMREGVGFKYVQGPLRLGSEYIRATGMIFTGPNPPFSPVGANVPVTQFGVESFNTADGYYFDAGWKFLEKFEADVRYDTYDRMKNSPTDERKYTTTTVGGQYFYSNAMRFSVNYEWRKLAVVNPGSFAATAAGQTALSNAQIIANSMGNRLSAQMTYTW
jgi:hypothetical protein